MDVRREQREIEQLDEEIVRQACARAITPLRQSDGSYRASAWFRCLLAQRR